MFGAYQKFDGIGSSNHHKKIGAFVRRVPFRSLTALANFPLCNYTLISLRFMPILGEHTESYMIYTSGTTQIHPGFYIYTHKRSFCLIVSIIINIRYISRCVIQISSQSGLCYMRSCLTISTRLYTSIISDQLRPSRTR